MGTFNTMGRRSCLGLPALFQLPLCPPRAGQVQQRPQGQRLMRPQPHPPPGWASPHGHHHQNHFTEGLHPLKAPFLRVAQCTSVQQSPFYPSSFSFPLSSSFSLFIAALDEAASEAGINLEWKVPVNNSCTSGCFSPSSCEEKAGMSRV